MFYEKERIVTIICRNRECDNFNKEKEIGVSQINSEEIKDLLRCPRCGKQVIINKVQNKK